MLIGAEGAQAFWMSIFAGVEHVLKFESHTRLILDCPPALATSSEKGDDFTGSLPDCFNEGSTNLAGLVQNTAVGGLDALREVTPKSCSRDQQNCLLVCSTVKTTDD
jgi:hypothetical protein